jgi:hypothetical protein
VRVSAYEVQRVLRRLNVKNTIVVGPVLEGHDFIANTGKYQHSLTYVITDLVALQINYYGILLIIPSLYVLLGGHTVLNCRN